VTVNSARRPLISIVSPAYNEEGNIDLFHAMISEEVAGKDYDIEFVFVNDGSRDGTRQALEKLAARDTRVRALNLSRNFGAIAACTAGLHHAVGDAIILMSSDLQDPASNVTKFVDCWRAGHDVVWAVRTARNDPAMKTLLADSFYWLIRKVAFPDYPERGTDSGLFDRAAVNVYRTLPERDSSPFYALYSYGFRHGYIEYERQARQHGASSWSLWRRVKNAVDVLTTFSVFPLKVITALGMIAFAMSLVGFVYVALFELLVGARSPGWASLVSIGLLVGGTQLLFLSILSLYVWRIGEQTKQRPRYIIAEAAGSLTGSRPARVVNILDLDVS
jgi:glycosyltransferase involved in cell wall biosynthesis